MFPTRFFFISFFSFLCLRDKLCFSRLRAWFLPWNAPVFDLEKKENITKEVKNGPICPNYKALSRKLLVPKYRDIRGENVFETTKALFSQKESKRTQENQIASELFFFPSLRIFFNYSKIPTITGPPPPRFAWGSGRRKLHNSGFFFRVGSRGGGCAGGAADSSLVVGRKNRGRVGSGSEKRTQIWLFLFSAGGGNGSSDSCGAGVRSPKNCARVGSGGG